MLFAWVCVAAAIVVLGLVRLAPVDPLDWNIQPDFTEDKTFRGGVFRVVRTGPDGLKLFDQVASASPRTKLLAGSVEDGLATYVTRTKFLGFPDYTTAGQDGDLLKVYARLRFGRSDLGVNGARIAGWLSEMGIQDAPNAAQDE